MFELIKLSLWGSGEVSADQDTYEEMKSHAIAALPMPYLSELAISEELKTKWKHQALQQLVTYKQYKYEESKLPISVPYVILKGSAAAQYYPYPEYRTMGDIDIMTRREDMDAACQQLLNNGYRIIKKLHREISFKKNRIIIEVHRQFATLNDPEKAKYLDDLIIDNINSSHMLPDLVNGLVLLEHIDQHMEGGIGIRQVIDWMLFVDKCLPDEKWPEFRCMAKEIGLEKLAIVTTHMCVMFLGLNERKWCADADDKLCEQLMDYILASGNFGNKRISDSDISQNVFAYASTPRMAFKLLQKQGLQNWQATRKHRILVPFAWIYQANRYIVRGLKRRKATSKIKAEYIAAKKRKAMFETLGIKTAAKGIVVYKDGEYVKK